MPSSKQLPPNEPANAPFQILKIYEYFRVFNEPEDVSFRSDLGIQADEPHTWIHTWLEELQNANKRSMYGWPRDQKEGTGSFYLVDHVWIWNAVSAISKMFPQKNDTMKMKKTKPKQQTTFQTSISIVNSEKAKVEILKRFTAFNSPFKERMLAVKRSLRESQFDFQFSDTALFYGFQYSGVPLLDPQDSRWRSAIKAQEKYVSEEQNQLENPSRDCMRLLMAEYITEHYQPFDARPQELQNPNALKTEEKKEFEVDLNQARENLVSLFLCNGLFRGLSSEYEIPVDPPSSRDYFLHTSFEAHYVLWNSFYRIKTEKPPAWTPSQKLSAPDNFSPIVQLNPNLDQNIVVEPSEEWLYNYPEFLDRKPNLPQVFDTYYNWLVERYRQQSHLQYVELAIEEAKGEPEGVETRLLNKFASNASRPHGCGNLMIDIPRKSNHSSKPFFSRPMSESWERLKKRRNITNSKKRLLWFAQPDLQVASLAFLASTDKEQIHMRSFLDRHASHSLFLENKAVRIRNVWETEFHCSFMQLVYRKGSKRTQAKNNRQTIDSHTHSPDCEHGMEFGEWDPASSEWSGKSSKRSIEDILRTRCPMVTPRAIHGWKDVALVRGSASFRFVGDFFDRYWTCHFLESYPAMETTVETTSDSASWESKLSFLSVKKSKCGRKDRYQNKDDDEQILKRVFGEDSKETEKVWLSFPLVHGLSGLI
ncbi:hypothetical protein N7478_000577 [Penicillium angulare]|uniref:uncharacterized protein n=1 Tax=Penicillium angulare TaxID=116970 RepID=UPI0025404D1E|nr:uncharacterized protein N7478_000577 [Penicillium angulare]KAJ5291326.1 hypothetical protein N7478_000577 [Penicillium angulare]